MQEEKAHANKPDFQVIQIRSPVGWLLNKSQVPLQYSHSKCSSLEFELLPIFLQVYLDRYMNQYINTETISEYQKLLIDS